MNIIKPQVAFRAFTERTESDSPLTRAFAKPELEPWSSWVLIIDAETETNAAQTLTVGCARVCRWGPDGKLRLEKEYLIYPDALPKRDSEKYEVFANYFRNCGESRLRLCSAESFLRQVLYPAFQTHTLIVGFNLPFDLSRLSIGWSECRGKRFRNGFSLRFCEVVDKQTGERHENRFWPRVRIKHLDSKRSMMGLSRVSKKIPLRAQFLDARTLAFGLTNEGYALETACDAFGVEHNKLKIMTHGIITPEYIDYNRRDVLATQELLEKLRAEFDRHPVSVFPAKVFSPASIAKSYLKDMGLNYPRKQFANVPVEVLAAAMLSYYGGRAECRIRLTPVPVVHCDFLSMYPTVNTLMELWNLLIAERIEVQDATEEVRELLENLSPEDCFNPEIWKQFNFFAQVIPDDDIFPVRAQYDPANSSFNIGVNFVSSEIPLLYAGPDLIASKVLRGKAPKIVRAIRLVSKGRQKGLRPIKLRGAVEIDPQKDDFFKAVIEQRKNLKDRTDLCEEEKERLDKFLKVLANSGSYGIFAELNPEELPVKETAKLRVHGLKGPFSAISRKPEDPGPFCFPPIAALITSAARLMLALLERLVADAGGTYAFCDTDSMAIVANKDRQLIDCPGGYVNGNQIRALSWQQVGAIVEKFAALNPYDRSIIPGSVLKIEDVNFTESGAQREIFAYMISAKRYALFTKDPDGKIEIIDAREHGLGHLLNPTDPEEPSRKWIHQLWEFMVLKELGRNPTPPAWLNKPAISRIGATTPEMVKRLNQARKCKPYVEQVKPFNFGLAAHVIQWRLPQGIDPERFQLIAPYEKDPRNWQGLPWVDRHSGKSFGITTGSSTQPDIIQLKSYADVLAEYATHPEPKSAGPAT